MQCEYLTYTEGRSKMKKILILVMACVMILSLAACGSKETPAENSSASESAAVPEGAVIAESEKADAVVDPASLNLGVSSDESHTGDAWYKDGVKGGNYIYFEKADNSDSGLACILVSGDTEKTWLCTVTADNHLLDQDAEDGKSEIDIVFTDIFTAVNNADGSKYIRGNADEIARLFVGKQLVEQENNANTLIFNADGTGTEVYDGVEYALTWELDSASTKKFADGENEFSMTISVDENGAFVSLYDMNLRTYVPAA